MRAIVVSARGEAEYSRALAQAISDAGANGAAARSLAMTTVIVHEDTIVTTIIYDGPEG